MKQVLIGIFLTLVSLITMAQDLIVTQEGDSLNCRIIKERNGYIYAAYMEEGKAKRNYFYSDLIKGKQKNFYKTSAIPSGIKLRTVEFGKIRLGIRHGWGYRLAKVVASDPAEKAYLKELKSGWTYNAEIEYFVTESIGVGIVGNIFKSSNTIDGTLTVEEEWYPATFSNRHIIWYVGPSVCFEHLSKNKKHNFVLRYSLGYIHYTDKESLEIFDQTFKQFITGGSLGRYLDVNYSYLFNPHIGVNANIALVGGILHSITRKDDKGNEETIQLEKGSYEGLGRVDISVGLVFVL